MGKDASSSSESEEEEEEDCLILQITREDSVSSSQPLDVSDIG